MVDPVQRLNNELNVVREHSESILSGDIAGVGADRMTDDEADQLICNVRTELDRILGLVNSRSIPTLKAFLPYLKSIKTEKNFTRALFRCRSVLQARRGGTIKVRPTSVMCRRPGMKIGYRWVSAGRPTSKSSKCHHMRPRLRQEHGMQSTASQITQHCSLTMWLIVLKKILLCIVEIMQKLAFVYYHNKKPSKIAVLLVEHKGSFYRVWIAGRLIIP